MRRTLLAVGFAVLVSMLLTPHKDYWNWLGEVLYVQPVKAKYVSTDPNLGLEPSSPRYNPNLPPHSYYEKRDAEHPTYYEKQPGYTPDWCKAWHWFPMFWIERRNSILWSNFVGQAAFVAVLAVIIVNIRPRRNKSRQSQFPT